MNETFFDRISRLENLGRERADFSRIKPLLSDEAARVFFYTKIADAGWIYALASAGEFNDPPESGSWPQSRFLVRAAQDNPAAVASVLSNLVATRNPQVAFDVAEVLLLLPQNWSFRT